MRAKSPSFGKPLEWSTTFEVGVEWLDADHRELADTLNGFLSACQSNSTAESLSSLIEDMIAKTKIHFQKEEAFLNKLGLANKLHDEEHEENLVELKEIHSNLSDTIDQNGCVNLYGQLASAFVRHVVSLDSDIKAYFDNRRP